jgi:acetoin utilization protein AcuB
MLVRDRMTKNPVTIRPSATVPDATHVMRGSRVRQLPVLTEKGELVGIVSLDDLLRVSPSPATSLSVYELNYLLEKIKVEDVMTREVITVTEDMALEEAGRIMADSKISGVPVMRDGELVGIVTESTLFQVLLEVFGARDPGVRVVFTIPEVTGTLAKITGAISERGGAIVAFGEALGEPGTRTITMKVQELGRETLLEALQPLVLDVEDVRES